MKESRLADRTRGWKPSETLAVMAEASRRKRAGQDIVDFGPGEPDFPTPAAIREAAKEALDEGFTHYTPTPGIPELREAVARRYRREAGASYQAEHVVVGCGGKHLLWETFHALFQEGDEVLLPTPAWTSFREQIAMSGARPVDVKAAAEEEFVPTVEALREALTERTRGIVVNSPSNPTGAVWPRETLEAVAELVLDRGLWVLADETYDRFLYDDAEHWSLASRTDLALQLVVVNSFSKTYAMTGWRLGYALGPVEAMEAIQRLQSQQTSGANSIAQKAGLAALEDPEDRVEAEVAKMLEAFTRRRRLVLEGLDEVRGLRATSPQGAFYVFPDAREAIEARSLPDDMAFCRWLIEEHGLALVPGTAFGAPGHVRLSFALGEEDIRRGLERLAEALE